MRAILVFQHMEVAHPGIFREFLRADGIAWQAVRLDRGEPIPDLAGFDALWVMGGAQDVWQEAEHPWLVAEKAAIREAVSRDMPFLGICLGHQLLADALGGEVGPAGRPEIGVFEVALTDRDPPLLTGLPASARFLQWHAAEVRRPPAGARVLATSPSCAIQAIAVGERAFGLQFHAEVDPLTLADWLGVPSTVTALEKAVGPEKAARFVPDADAHMAEFEQAARQLYANLMAPLRRVMKRQSA